MTTCRAIQERLGDWLDETLPAEERRRIDSHLRTCDACRTLFDQYEALDAGLAALGGVGDRIAARSAGRFRWRSLWRMPFRVAALVALAVSLSVASSSYWMRGRPPAVSNHGVSPLVANVESEDVSLNRDTVSFDLLPGEGQIAMPLESGNPRVHVVWLYETVRAPERDAAGGDEDESLDRG